MEIGELKRELGRCRDGKVRRYPAAVREAVLAYAEQAKREGRSHCKAAAELGMSVQTLCGWWAQRREALVPVAIVGTSAASGEIVVECGALRVRGLDVDGVVELLKRLG
jgi:transposase-like protein